MQPRKIAAALALGVVLCSGSFVLGQNTQSDTQAFETELEQARTELNWGEWSKTSSGAEKTAALAEKAVGNSALTKTFTKQAVSRFYSGGDTKASIRLQALQVAQNQRIIELLEKLATDKN